MMEEDIIEFIFGHNQEKGTVQMKIKKFAVVIALMVSVFSTGCGRLTDLFFVRNEVNTEVVDEETAHTEAAVAEDSIQIESIDFSEEGMNVDGKIIPLPAKAHELIALWGEPRLTLHDGKRFNYTWDELGLYCYAYEDGTVHCIGVKVNPSIDIHYYPKKMYTGNMTVGGEPWYEVVQTGEDLEFFRKCIIGDYSLYAEYTDIYNPEATGTDADYDGIEMSLDD